MQFLRIILRLISERFNRRNTSHQIVGSCEIDFKVTRNCLALNIGAPHVAILKDQAFTGPLVSLVAFY